VYGAPGGIPSLNFENHAWWVAADEAVRNPYELLPPVFDDLPLADDAELRLVGVSAGRLELAWVRPNSDRVLETMTVSRQMFDDIEEDRVGNWQPLRDAISKGPFVDVNRLLVATD
jgi:hypothetical protein